MNILTGIAFCVFVLFFLAARGGEAGKRETEIWAHVSAVSFICLLLLGGHWIAVLLGKL